MATVFSSPDFRVAEWANEIIAASSASASSRGLEGELAQVRAQLSARDGELNEALESGMCELLAATPRAANDSKRLETVSASLANELAQVEEQLNCLDAGGTNMHVDLLSRLDMVKRNMRMCSDTLREARSWEAQVREVRSRLAQGDLSGVVEKLDGMTHSLSILESMPNGEERSETLSSLRSALETELKPKVQAALSAEHTAALAEFVSMYSKLGKTQVLVAEYVASRPINLHSQWFKYVALPPGSRPSFQAWLSGFCGKVRGLLKEERRRATEVFGVEDAPQIICSVVMEIFQPLCDPMRNLLEDCAVLPWQEAGPCYSEALSLSVAVLVAASGAARSDLLSVLRCVISPFKSLQVNFRDKETEHLRRVLQNTMEGVRTPSAVLPPELIAGPESAFRPRVEELQQATQCVMEAVRGAIGRCLELTSGAQARGLLLAISDILDGAISDVVQAVDGSRVLCGPLTQQASSYDWDFLEVGLSMLQWMGELQHTLEALEKDLAQGLGEVQLRLFDLHPQPMDVALKPTMDEAPAAAEALRLLLGRIALDEDEMEKGRLKSTLDSVTGAALVGEVLHAPAQRLDVLQISVQDLVFDLCFSVIRHSLTGYSNLPTWGRQQGKQAVNVYSAAFSYDAPQTCVTAAGEHLLSLLQQLEPFAQSHALEDAMQASEGVGRLGTAQWVKLGWKLSLSESELENMEHVSRGMTDVQDLLRWPSADGSLPGQSATNGQALEEEEEEEEDEEFDSAMSQFCNSWLRAVGLGTMGAFLTQVVQVAELHDSGAAQLATDAAYLANVLVALDLPVHPLMTHVQRICRSSPEELLALLKREHPASELGAIVAKFEACLCQARGARLPTADAPRPSAAAT